MIRLVACTTLLLFVPAITDAQRADNAAAAPSARRGGWERIFDGSTLTGWRGWRQPSGAKGWAVEDGAIARVGEGGDILFDRELGDFELRLEWKIAPGGNSGIFWHASETTTYPWEGAPEMQVLDDAGHADGKLRETSAGANFGLYAAAAGAVRPAGEWNAARLRVRGNRVEHWLNGRRVVAYTLGDDEWKRRVAASKFKDMPKYGTFARGLIVLQDHGDRVWYRNIELREFK
ncbi:MAG: DUF1080 domain-containing protein [Gemmatimonadaceae bacterium]|nr:DUF1080 domain-containing protein [Gemmatimonadaceae bacterium]